VARRWAARSREFQLPMGNLPGRHQLPDGRDRGRRALSDTTEITFKPGKWRKRVLRLGAAKALLRKNGGPPATGALLLSAIKERSLFEDDQTVRRKLLALGPSMPKNARLSFGPATDWPSMKRGARYPVPGALKGTPLKDPFWLERCGRGWRTPSSACTAISHTSASG